MTETLRAHTPPRGWNSWDCFGTSVTEAEVLANAKFMSEHLLRHGWDTIVVDAQWFEPAARRGGYNEDADVVLDSFGRPQPTLNRFPSASDGKGFAPLSSAIHDLGLKFGVHVMRGVPRRAARDLLPVEGTRSTAADIANYASPCHWNTDNWGIDLSHPDGVAYYRSLARMLASWGVDFVKADDMLWPYHQGEIEAFAAALHEADPSIVLSLSPGEDVSTNFLGSLRENSTMWRISNDLWDRWQDVLDQFQRMARWAPLSRVGAWADADMLPLGHIGIRAERGDDRDSGLTIAEQRTLLTLWAIGGSPLFMGGDLPTSSDETIRLLSNEMMLLVNAHGEQRHEVLRELDYVAWTAVVDGDPFAAIFNISDTMLTREIRLDALGLVGEFDCVEAWFGTPSRVNKSIPVLLEPHDAMLVRLSRIVEVDSALR
ncbi:MAG: glycoside hydrolase family 27 protein [Lacisediminihabitans sp.]